MAIQKTQVKENLWSLEMGYVRAYLAVGEDSAFLFDTGLAGNDMRSAVSEITDKKIIVLNTHSDYDHVGSNAQFDDIYLHPADYFKYGADGGGSLEGVKPICDGQIFDNGIFCFEAIYLPGHTPGSVAFLEKNRRFLVGGDMFSIMVYLWGKERSIYAYRQSLEKLKRREAEFDHILAYHGEMVLGTEAIENFAECVNGILDGSIKGFKDTTSGFDTGNALVYSTGKANILLNPEESGIN